MILCERTYSECIPVGRGGGCLWVHAWTCELAFQEVCVTLDARARLQTFLKCALHRRTDAFADFSEVCECV